LEVVRLLLDHRADVKVSGRIYPRPTETGVPLHSASLKGHLEVVKLLLDSGADVNARGNRSTALHLAAGSGYLQVVDLLLKRGGDPRAKNEERETPFQVASRRGYSAIMLLIAREHAVEG
jgi:ankyrin repeat protein